MTEDSQAPGGDGFYQHWGKRWLDCALAALALAALSPLLLLLALLVRLNLGTPVLFRQRRPGWRERPFILLKFRTMTEAVDTAGQPLPDGQRLTALGRFLRATSLDELPELYNVLKGDMSLVGPRPLLMQYLERYTPEQRRRHAVRPGLTGWAQVHGRNALTWEEKFKRDLWYVDHLSPWLDGWVMALTLWKLITREGIAEIGQATATEFMGHPR